MIIWFRRNLCLHVQNRISLTRRDRLTTHVIPPALSDIDWASVITKASNRAVGGGLAGASAAGVQVLSLMWLRTSMNYQYKYGSSLTESLNKLYSEGGIPRLYQGISYALIQGPLSRFGDTAANALVLTVLQSCDPSNLVPTFARTGLGSIVAGCWRIVIMPIDTFKTSLQVNGKQGYEIIMDRLRTEGPKALFAGSLAASAATMVGHFPWFYTYNTLSELLPTADQYSHLIATLDAKINSNLNLNNIGENYIMENFELSAATVISHLDPTLVTLLRSAFIGLCASSVSDVCSNSLRVLKTAKQSSSSDQTYVDIGREIVARDGLLKGLFGRGLQVGVLCTVDWHCLTQRIFSLYINYLTLILSPPFSIP